MSKPNAFANRQEEPELETRQSLVDLLTSLVRQMAGLIRDEVDLTKAELRDRLEIYRAAISITAVGIVLGLLASMAGVAAAIIALAPHVGAALAALIVGSVLGAVSIILFMQGMRHFRR